MFQNLAPDLYRYTLDNLPPPGSDGFFPALETAANFGLNAGRESETIFVEFREIIPKELCSDKQVYALIDPAIRYFPGYQDEDEVEPLEVPVSGCGENKPAEPTSDSKTNQERTFALSDLGNAERLVYKFGSDIRFCPSRKRWLLWKGNHWAWDFRNEIEKLAKLTVRAIFQEAMMADSDRVKEIGQHATLTTVPPPRPWR